LPPQGREWCLLCAADWKAQAITIARERGIDLARDGADLTRLMGNVRPELAVAETTMVLPVPSGVGPQAGQPMVVTGPSCWAHLTPIKVVESALAIAGSGSPFAGAVDLGQRR
jgi:hypothetical protein